MNELIIPPSPNWYSDSILVCTPEEHVVYASRKDIVIMHPAPLTEAADIRIIHGAHDERVLSINANLVTWGKPNRQLVSVGDDKVVKIWNFDTLTCEMQHSDHEKNGHSIISASFAGERVISVAENGHIVVWQTTANTRRTIMPNSLFGMKVKVMCMATCPHAVYLTAFGLASGLVVVADLRQYGKVLYKLREHDHDITGLSWCPTPYNIYRTKSGIQMMDSLRRKPRNNLALKNSDKKVPDQTIEELNKNQENIESKSSDIPEETIQQNVPESPETNVSNDDFNQMCMELQENLQKDKATPPASPKKEVKENSPRSPKKDVQETPQTPEISLKSLKIDDSPKVSDDDFLGEIVYPTRERPVVDKKNPWGNVVFNDSDEEQEEKTETREIQPAEEVDDFLLECQRLKAKITFVTEKTVDVVDTIEEEDDIEKPSEVEEADEIENASEVQEDVAQNETEGTNQDLEEPKIEPIEKTEELSQRNIVVEDYVLDLSLANPEEKKEFLLASACRSGKVCIWRAGSDGRLQIQLPKHMKTNYTNRKRDNRQNWISICWAQPTLILTSSIWHELLMWNILPKPKNMKFQIKSSLVHADHNKYIFTIASPYHVYEKPENENWRDDKELCVWTTSHDRWLLRTNLATKYNISCYFTFGGNVSCISVSQLDPNRLAFAAGDGSIRIWDLSRPHKQHITSTAYFDKVHTKASCIDWHPTRENFLAFSTCDGRIGEYDLTNRSKVATIYSQYHRSDVYKLQWGPMPGDEERYGLYSCSLGELIIHDSSKPNKEPIQLALFDDEHDVVNFSWKSDYSVLAIGSKTGAVRLLNSKFQLLQTLYMQKKSVRGLEWHPLATAMDSGLSEYSNTLAVSTKENEIFVYDCLNQHGDADKKINHIVLKGHKSSVKSIAWCPHVSGRLVSSDENGISVVWDIKTQTMLSVFYTNSDYAPIVVWSPLDADLIISGGKHLQLWRITKNPPVLPTIIPKKHQENLKNKKLIKITTKPVDDEVFAQKRGSKYMLALTFSALNNPTNTLSSCRKLMDNKNEKAELEIQESDSSDEEEFEDAKEHSDGDISIDPLKLFGKKKDVLSLLDHEQIDHLQKKKITKHGLVGLWKGNLSDTIKHAIELNEITPWLINMAPMVSHKVWLDLCEKYAQILCDKEEYIEASSYYLTCHKIDEAINALCKGHHYTEALTLAKVRLSEGHEQISVILEKWLKYCVINGMFEVAALLYIKTGKYLEAAQILNKRPDLETLKLAAELAEQAADKDLLNTINAKISELEKSAPKSSNGVNICESRLQALLLNDQKNNLFQNGVEKIDTIVAAD